MRYNAGRSYCAAVEFVRVLKIDELCQNHGSKILSILSASVVLLVKVSPLNQTIMMPCSTTDHVEANQLQFILK